MPMTGKKKRRNDSADSGTHSGGDQRLQAERTVRKNIAQTQEIEEPLSLEEARSVLRELKAHQLELEIQNEELRLNRIVLEASLARYSDFYNFAPVGYLTLSPQGLILEVNLTLAAQLGAEKENLISQPFTRFILPADQDQFYLHSKHLFAAGEAAACELRLMKKGGGQFWARMESTLICNADGTAQYRSVVNDISERKKAEDAVLANQARYRALVDQSFEALALVDIDTREILEVNRRFTELLGYSLPKDAPLYVNKYVVDPKANLDRIFNETLKQQRFLLPEELIFQHKNGSQVFVERVGTVISFDGRDYLLQTMRDMTTERRRQAEMNRDVEFARRVQMSLLPDLPESPFIMIRTLYHPSHFVSGDSYHLEWHNDEKLLRGFLIDVSGHGLATALQTASVKVLLREASISQLPLIKQVQWVNARAAKYFSEGSYAAMLGFEMDLTAGTLRYASSGITQFYANGRKILTPGMFVGVWEDAEFSADVLPISAGDTFYFLTDGFTDILAQPENADFWSPGGKDIDADVASLERLAGLGPLRDDATAVCLKIRELGT